jgi:alkanesulfonate monooxygenase SsuD/methylene tetrahydromethanopterin reductase-like flavin-dependent oxidoreductase (luciferase family)
MDLLAEQVEIVNRLWDQERARGQVRGRVLPAGAVQALPLPVQEPHPPLILGGGAGPRAAALAARWADEYDVVSVDPDEARSARARLSGSCEAIDRDPGTLRLSLMTGVVVGADRREVERRAAALMDHEGRSGDVREAIDRWRSDRLAGTVEEVLGRLAEYAEVGVDRVLMQHLVHDDLEMLELIGSEIVPAAGDL